VTGDFALNVTAGASVPAILVRRVVGRIGALTRFEEGMSFLLPNGLARQRSRLTSILCHPWQTKFRAKLKVLMADFLADVRRVRGES